MLASDIGVRAFVMPSAEAEAHNRTALRAHHLGDYAASLAGFTEALVASPGYAMARFNQACALARLGRTDEAEALMMTLLAEDLPTFAQRFLDDDDLSSLREGQHNVRLRAAIEQLLPVMQQAWSRGALAYVHAPFASEPGGRAVLGLSMGVIDPQTNRFVSIVPRASNALGMQIDRSAGVAFVLHGRVRQGTFWSAYFVPEEVEVFDLARPFERVFQASLMALVGGGPELPAITLVAGRDHVDVRLDSIDLDSGSEGTERFRVTETGRAPLTTFAPPSEGTLWVRSDRPNLPRDAPPSSASLRFEEGTLIRLAEGTHPEVRVSLGARHTAPRLLLSPDGARAFVRTETVRCVYRREQTGFRTAFDLVDLTTGTVTHLETGEQDALFEGRFAGDGTFYFQAGEVARRYAPGSTEAMFDVPENVVLTTTLMAWQTRLNCEI